MEETKVFSVVFVKGDELPTYFVIAKNLKEVHEKIKDIDEILQIRTESLIPINWEDGKEKWYAVRAEILNDEIQNDSFIVEFLINANNIADVESIIEDMGPANYCNIEISLIEPVLV